MSLEEIKQLEAELKKKKEAAIADLLKKRSEIDKQLTELGHGEAPVKQKRKRRTKEEIAQEKAAN